MLNTMYDLKITKINFKSIDLYKKDDLVVCVDILLNKCLVIEDIKIAVRNSEKYFKISKTDNLYESSLKAQKFLFTEIYEKTKDFCKWMYLTDDSRKLIKQDLKERFKSENFHWDLLSCTGESKDKNLNLLLFNKG